MKKGIDYIGVGVGGIIFNDVDQVFIAKRGKDAKNEKGTWEFPGGGVEFGDTLEDTIVRELMEEFDIKVSIVELLGVNNHLIPAEKQHWVTAAYICKIVSGEPKIMEPNKIEDMKWINLKDMETLPLSIVTQLNLRSLKYKYPEKFI